MPKRKKFNTVKIRSSHQIKRPLVITFASIVVGVTALVIGFAATGNLPSISIDLGNSSVKSGPAQGVSDTQAFGGSAIKFGTANTGAQANLSMILGSAFRNKNEDASPYLTTPSASLPINTLAPFGNRGDYADSVVNTNSPNEGIFRVQCEFSHFAYDDPIVYKNKPGTAHLHMFWGNTHANAYTDYSSLMNSGGSTCNGHELNRTAYWAPAVIDGSGKVRIPSKILMYYKSFSYTQPGAVGRTKVYPENMQIVADKSININAVDTKPEFPGYSDVVTSFLCVNKFNGDKNNFQETMPTCTGDDQPNYTWHGPDRRLEVNIKFPQCYKPNVNAADYKNNLAVPLYHWYSGACPSSHPDNLPNLEYRIWYNVEKGEDTSNWFLSSDVDHMTGAITGARGGTVHADWFGGWNKEVNKLWIDECNNKPRVDCGNGFLGGSLVTDTAYRALKIRTPYTGPMSVSGAELYKTICKTGKTITKPADLAYCLM
jgi:hypothetical protein